MCLAALDVRADGLSRPRRFQADHGSASDEGGFTLDHVDDIGFLIMHLDLTGLLAVAAGNGEVRGGYQGSSFVDGRGYLVVVNIGDFSRGVGSENRAGHRQYCGESE